MQSELLALMVERDQQSPRKKNTEADLAIWIGRTVDNNMLNEISLVIARSYQDRSISYEIADSIMNDLWGVVIDRSFQKKSAIPSPFYEVYEAFDAGEYHRRPDASDDPVADHTDPLIAELLERYPADAGH